jgi:hypothetical protein
VVEYVHFLKAFEVLKLFEINFTFLTARHCSGVYFGKFRVYVSCEKGVLLHPKSSPYLNFCLCKAGSQKGKLCFYPGRINTSQWKGPVGRIEPAGHESIPFTSQRPNSEPQCPFSTAPPQHYIPSWTTAMSSNLYLYLSHVTLWWTASVVSVV